MTQDSEDQPTEYRASHPGGIDVSLLRWCLRYPKWPVILLGGALGFAVAAVLVHWSLWLLAVPFAACFVLYRIRIRSHFQNGNASPGRVISTSPLLIAVRTDLTMGRGYFPAIRVIREKPSSRWPEPLEVGQQVATCALYHKAGEDDGTHWDTFDPRPVEPVASDPQAAASLLASFPPHQWDQLDRGIGELGSPTEGLHRLELGKSDWARASSMAPPTFD